MSARELFRVVHGIADDAELAALVIVLSRLSARHTVAPVRSHWADLAGRRTGFPPGPGVWRLSGLPL